MRTHDPEHINATEIVDTLLAWCIKDMFRFHDGHHVGIENKKRLRTAMENIRSYLDSYANILSQKFIFFLKI